MERISRYSLRENELIWDLVPVLLSLLLGFLLWKLDITQIGASVAAALLLELVIVSHRNFYRTKQLLPYLGQVSSVPQLSAAVAEVSRLAGQGGSFRPLLVEEAVRDFNSLINRLGRGRASLSPDQFMKFACILYQKLGPGDTLIATSLNAGGEYWKQNFGAAYAALNRAAADRGASIERIYILRDKLQAARHHQTMVDQCAFSEVRAITLEEMRVDALEQRDIFVINTEIAAEFHFTDQYVIQHIDLITDIEEVQAMKQMLLNLRQVSAPVAPNSIADGQ